MDLKQKNKMKKKFKDESSFRIQPMSQRDINDE